MSRLPLTICVCFCVIAVVNQCSLLSAQRKAKKSESDNELTLEQLFPEESIFGPSARATAFSSDGRYAAYLYRPYEERRHGNDLWVYDFKTRKKTRLTDLATMSKFQRSARVVKRDRLAKHKKSSGSKKGTGTEKPKKEPSNKGQKDNVKKTADNADIDSDTDAQRQLVNSVYDGDADDKYAPRYEGINDFRWHPTENAMLVFSQGDVYHIADVSKPELKRLTRTSSTESQVNFLPDGSGFTYNLDNAVYRMKFGSHLIEQLNPRLESGRRLASYSISPDGKKLVLVARTQGGFFSSSSRKVDIIRYRDRFAKADSISRTVSDDQIKPQDVYVYLFDFEKIAWEESDLLQVFHTQIDDPRDVISEPKWSLDSQKITFCFFNQKDAIVEIRVGQFPASEQYETLLAAAEKKAAEKRKKRAADAKKEDEKQNRRPRPPQVSRAPLTIEYEAKTLYEFKHDGGPNTPRMVSPDWAADSKHVVFVSEISGFRHLHILDTVYQSVRQLTSGHYEVYPFDFSDDRKTIFVTATKDSPAQTMVYSVDIDSGEMKRVSRDKGVYRSVAIDDHGTKMLANYATYGKLNELIAQDGKRITKITDSHPDTAVKLTQWKPDFFGYENREGHRIHGMMFKPDRWKANAAKKTPLLIYVYGGPLGTAKSVVDASYRSDSYFFPVYMAKKHGYLTVVIDPRGQSGYGGLFEKSNYEQVGKPQVNDLVDGVKFLADNYNIDQKRVAIHGWSFGGFQTQMCLYTEPKVFQVGMAGAGPTEWENYNAWYTTGTVGPSKTGKPDQKKYSLRPLAKNLQGKLLLIHGIEDTNVLFQDTVAIYRELLKAGKETNVELFLDPTGGHGLGGDVKRLGRMRKYEEFLLRTIGSASGT